MKDDEWVPPDVAERLIEMMLAAWMQAAADEIKRLRRFERYYDERMMYPAAFKKKWGQSAD